MVKAHSLLYAIYICLIVSIICGALLYIATLYNQLNLYYNIHEELYIHNQSVVNYALSNKIIPEEISSEENLGIQANFESKSYGLLTLLIAKSFIKGDTVSSAHFVGHFISDKTAIHLANFSKSLSFSGKVKLIGDNKLPSPIIETTYMGNKSNELIVEGTNTVSEIRLPEVNSNFKKIFGGINAEKIDLSKVEKSKDSLYYNSFLNQTKEIYLSNPVVSNMIFKGNFILRSKDSIRIRKNVVLEDVILLAPKITFEEGFSGNVQAFATKGIELEEKVRLNYPSILCVYNESTDISKIKIKKGCEIKGGVVLFGNPIASIDKNSIEFEEEGLLMGDIFCSGKLMIKSNVYGAVYTNRFYYKSESATYDNAISDIEINANKRPSYFIGIPLFDVQKTQYGILKKVQ